MKSPSYNFGVMMPTIRKVTEIYEQSLGGSPHYARAIAMIAPDPNAGRKNRYSVIRIYSHTGQVTVIGRELPLGIARKVAKRLVSEDGKAEGGDVGVQLHGVERGSVTTYESGSIYEALAKGEFRKSKRGHQKRAIEP